MVCHIIYLYLYRLKSGDALKSHYPMAHQHAELGVLQKNI